MPAAAALLACFLLGGTSQLQAHDGYNDRNGFRDGNGYYHHYEYRHHHRGYWHEHNGSHIWINIG